MNHTDDMVLLISAHPDPDSFTAALAEAMAAELRSAGIELLISDLYKKEGGLPFPPILDTEELHRKTSLDAPVQRQMRRLEEAGAFIVVHPDWWGGPPAILKGWVDRVFRSGTAYEIPEGFGHREPVGLLTGRKAMVVVTGDAEGPGPLEEFWCERVWGFCGVEAEILYFPRVAESSITDRDRFVAECRRRVAEKFGEDRRS